MLDVDKVEKVEIGLQCFATLWTVGSLVLQFVADGDMLLTLLAACGLLVAVASRILRKRRKANA